MIASGVNVEGFLLTLHLFSAQCTMYILDHRATDSSNLIGVLINALCCPVYMYVYSFFLDVRIFSVSFDTGLHSCECFLNELDFFCYCIVLSV